MFYRYGTSILVLMVIWREFRTNYRAFENGPETAAGLEACRGGMARHDTRPHGPLDGHDSLLDATSDDL